MSPRRLTRIEENALAYRAGAMRSAERAFEEATAGLDHLIAELDRDGARMTDIADTLGISRTTAYARRDRALQRDPDLSHPPGQ